VAVWVKTSRDYGVTAKRAVGVVEELHRAVSRGRTGSDPLGIPCAEQELMAPAFTM
jgi:hypothetical protein